MTYARLRRGIAMMIRGARFAILFAFAAAAAAAFGTPSGAATPPDQPDTGPVKALIRYPTLHGNTVVFEAGGKLWKTTTNGGVATQLTSDSGFDMAPHFSPDGRWIAFTGWYQGNTDVYVIPVAGGPVKRLTYRSMNRKIGKTKVRPTLDNIVLGWTPDSKDVVFLSRRTSFNPQVMHAFTVPVAGGLPTQLPLPWTGPLSFSPDGQAVAYNKLSRVFRPFHRKHYFGGQAQDIWIYNFKSQKVRQITHWKGADVWPMWHGNTLYFTSDRGAKGVQNLWSYSLNQNHFTQLTHFDTYDVDSPTLGNDGIALSDGGDLYVYLFSDQKLQKINVRVPLNGIASEEPHWVDAGHQVNAAGVAPNGKLAVFSARGALFTVPGEYGSTLILTHDPVADERDPAWSPDGTQIAYILAKGDSDEIAVRPATGGPPHLLTHDSKLSYQGPVTWSPNGDWISYVDADQTLWLQNVKSGQKLRVTTDPAGLPVGSFSDVAWSPGSDWVAFSRLLSNGQRGLFLYHLADHSLHQVSDGQYNDSTPAFSDDGKYLFFASVRLTHAAPGNFDAGVIAGLNSNGLYVTTLSKSTASPLAPREPTATSASKDKGQADKNGDKGKAGKSNKHTGPVHIDLTGLMARAVRLPVPATNIGGIVEAGGVVYYDTMPVQTFSGSLGDAKPELRAYDLSKRKDVTLDNGGAGLMLSADGSTLLYQAKGQWILRPAQFNAKAKVEKLDLDHVRRWVEPRREWATIFGEAWRDVRDYFFNPDLVKSDWPAISARYRRLLPFAASRNDVNWLIANMIGSFGESHMYVSGGDQGWKSPAVTTADLGVDFALDAASGRYRLARIYRGDNTIPNYRAPLAQPGLKVAQGDYVLAINGQPLKAPMSPYELLNGTYGTTVRLRLAKNPAGTGAWTISVRPVANATKLRLLAWIRHNRAMVSKLSGGKLGYIYLNDFEPTGMHEFLRQYYSQTRMQGIVIDDRWNLGGSDIIENTIFDRLARRPTVMYTDRHGWTQPYAGAFFGVMAVVDNRGSASNGDIFPYMFKHDHLGPVIGSRTWAGVRGYAGSFRLLDGGQMTVSDIGLYGLNSQWIVENIGVRPDVLVHDEPGDLNRGHDAQLQTAVHMLMQNLKSNPHLLPPPPAWTPAFPPQPAWPKCTDSASTSTCG